MLSLLLALPLLTAEPTLAQEAPSPRITVAGQGTASARPDHMVLDMGVAVVRPTSQRALADAAARTQELVRTLRRAGIAERDLQTRTLQIQPQYDYRDRRSVLIGYQASNILTVRVRDLDRAGALIDSAVQAAGDEAVLQGIRFAIDDDQQLRRTAREAAWNDAATKARQLASLANVRLGTPLHISEQTTFPRPMPFAVQERAMAADAATTPVEPGEVSVIVDLSVEFALEPLRQP